MQEDPCLVRGLDYYNDTCFEIQAQDSSDTLIGGGRYDALAPLMLQKELNLPAVGFAGGVERIVNLLGEERREKIVSGEEERRVKIGILTVYSAGNESLLDRAYEVLAALTKGGRGKDLAEEFSFELSIEQSLTKQLKRSNRNGEDLVIIIGEDEWK